MPPAHAPETLFRGLVKVSSLVPTSSPRGRRSQHAQQAKRPSPLPHGQAQEAPRFARRLLCLDLRNWVLRLLPIRSRREG
eukprot:11984587-Alexandrium_andersonii.AAC.1